MSIDGLYKTSGLYIAAWLLLNGLELEGIDRSNKQRNDFIFTVREDRLDPVDSLMCGQAKAE